MGLRGPAPKPAELKRIQGTFRADRASLYPPEPLPNPPVMPEWIEQDVDARLEWERALAEAPWIRKVDASALEVIARATRGSGVLGASCSTVSRWRRRTVRSRIRRSGSRRTRSRRSKYHHASSDWIRVRGRASTSPRLPPTTPSPISARWASDD